MFDILVVGAGATGTWAVKALTEGGLKVALVEAGPSMIQNRDFASASLGKHEADAQTVRPAFIASEDIKRPFFVNYAENPYSTPPSAPFNWVRGRQVGGRLHTWSRHAPRISDQEFLTGAVGDIRSWPLSHEVLAPHYARIERRLGVFGRADGIPAIPDGEFLPNCVLSALATEVSERVLASRPQLQVTPARNVRHNDGRIPLALADAQKTGRLTLIPDTVVHSVLVDEEVGKATGVLVVDRTTKVHRELFGKAVVLAASAFESVRILLNSRTSRYFHGIGAAGGSGVLGHYVSDHVLYVTSGSLSLDQQRRATSSSWAALDDYDFAHTTLYLPAQQAENEEFIGKYGIQLVLSPKGTRCWVALAFGEMFPRFENAICLDTDLRDAWGVPSLHIDCRHSDNEVKMVAHMKMRLSALAQIAGLKETVPRVMQHEAQTAYGAFVPGSSIHEVGGARMGRSPLNSVLNEFCQCWACENVFVVDGACFPYLPFQNPTLTMMAITDRVCDSILRRFSTISHSL